MSRLAMSLLASVVLVGTAHADTFGGWEYQPPPGYTTQVHPDHVSLTKETGSTFCSIALFEARALEGSVAKETAWEWHNTVTHAFTAKITRRARMQTKAGLGVSAITAALVARDGSEYAAVHYAVMPPGVIGSVLLISSSPASLRECEPVVTRLVSRPSRS